MGERGSFLPVCTQGPCGGKGRHQPLQRAHQLCSQQSKGWIGRGPAPQGAAGRSSAVLPRVGERGPEGPSVVSHRFRPGARAPHLESLVAPQGPGLGLPLAGGSCGGWFAGATQCGLRKGRNVTEAGCGSAECSQLWVFLGAEIDVSRDGGPSLSVPTTHTRTFLQRVAVELEAKDTLWKSEFHSLLAKSSFLLGEGVRVCARACAHTAMGAGGGRGAWVEQCLTRRVR